MERIAHRCGNLCWRPCINGGQLSIEKRVAPGSDSTYPPAKIADGEGYRGVEELMGALVEEGIASFQPGGVEAAVLFGDLRFPADSYQALLATGSETIPGSSSCGRVS